MDPNSTLDDGDLLADADDSCSWDCLIFRVIVDSAVSFHHRRTIKRTPEIPKITKLFRTIKTAIYLVKFQYQYRKFVRIIHNWRAGEGINGVGIGIRKPPIGGGKGQLRRTD